MALGVSLLVCFPIQLQHPKAEPGTGGKAAPSPGATLQVRGKGLQRGKGFREQESPLLQFLLAVPHLQQHPWETRFSREK